MDARALASAATWLDRHGAVAAVVPHGVADGLAAGALLARRARGPVLHVESPWESRVTDGVPAVMADWGVRPLAGPSAALYVDHHAEPEAVPGTVLHAVAEDTTTSTLAWDLLDRPVDGAWLAALGLAGDLGNARLAARPELGRGRSHSALRRLATLASAPGRLRDGPAADAFTVLADSRDEREALAHRRIGALEDARAAAGAARDRALRTAPAVGRDAALRRFREPARVHPLVAVAWARRLAPRVVVAANDGWRDGRAAFAVRSADDRDLRAWLRERYTPPADAGDYARGHARATGGALVPDAFDELEAAIL